MTSWWWRQTLGFWQHSGCWGLKLPPSAPSSPLTHPLVQLGWCGLKKMQAKSASTIQCRGNCVRCRILLFDRKEPRHCLWICITGKICSILYFKYVKSIILLICENATSHSNLIQVWTWNVKNWSYFLYLFKRPENWSNCNIWVWYYNSATIIQCRWKESPRFVWFKLCPLWLCV